MVARSCRPLGLAYPGALSGDALFGLDSRRATSQLFPYGCALLVGTLRSWAQRIELWSSNSLHVWYGGALQRSGSPPHILDDSLVSRICDDNRSLGADAARGSATGRCHYVGSVGRRIYHHWTRFVCQVARRI